MGAYEQDWLTRVHLPLDMIQKIFSLLSLDPLGKDTSEDLYAALVSFDTFESFTAVQGFGYAFQDELATLADSVGSSVIRIENTLNVLIGEGIDDKLASFFFDQQCKSEYTQSAKTIRRAYRKLANLI
jgi:hypothetical protein